MKYGVKPTGKKVKVLLRMNPAESYPCTEIVGVFEFPETEEGWWAMKRYADAECVRNQFRFNYWFDVQKVVTAFKE